MADTAVDPLVERLEDWGMDTVFGLPGDGINGSVEALRRRRERIRFVQVQHEETAAFMAAADAAKGDDGAGRQIRDGAGPRHP